MHMHTRTLVSGALSAGSFAQLQPGTLVADEFGKLLGIVAGPYVSPDPRNYATDADNLLVIVDVDASHPSYKRFGDSAQVCINGSFLHPLEHGPLLDDDPEPSYKPGADAEAWHAAWNAWYARRQDLDEARRGMRHALETIAERGTTLPPPDAAPTAQGNRLLELAGQINELAGDDTYGLALQEIAEELRELAAKPSPLDDLNPHRLHPPTQWLREQTTYDEDANVYYEPIVVDGRVGYRVAGLDARETYVYFNPSTGGGGDPDHTPNVFVYLGEECDPAVDDADCSITITF